MHQFSYENTHNDNLKTESSAKNTCYQQSVCYPLYVEYPVCVGLYAEIHAGTQ